MDISKLKDKLGDDYDALATFVGELQSQRDEARNESINKRKTLKADLEAAQSAQQQLMEKLGIESLDDLDGLDISGQAEAAKQYEARIKRMERELATAQQQASELDGKYRGTLKQSALARELSKHEFIAPDLVETYISSRLEFEGDDLLYRNDEGTLLPLQDGISGFAKARPDLIKAQGTRGAGVNRGDARGKPEAQTMSRAEFAAMSPDKQMEAAKSGVTIS